MSFAALKRNRTDVSQLVAAAEKAGGAEQNRGDDRFWQPTRDKAGNGYAVIRFLPGNAEAPTPWVRYWDHGFKGPTGQWYIEKSLSSIGQPDPVGELNGRMWNNPHEFGMSEQQAQALVRQRKRNLRYVANVLVIEDPAQPENNGQVKLYRFGKRIFDKIMDAMQPKFPDETPINPFDMWQGADFVLKIRQVDGYPNYDKSEFKSPAALFGGDEDRLETLYNQQHDTSEWVDPKNFKSYDELKARLALVLGESAPRTKKQEAALDDEIPYERLDNRQASAPEPRSAPAANLSTAESSMDDDDDLMAQFSKLVND
jgi:hypothetical protein